MIAVSPISAVDDAQSVCESLPDLLKQFGYAVCTSLLTQGTGDVMVKPLSVTDLIWGRQQSAPRDLNNPPIGSRI